MALNQASAGTQQQLVPGGSGKARDYRPETCLLAYPLPVVSAVAMSEQTCPSLFMSSCPLLYSTLPKSLSPIHSNMPTFLTFLPLIVNVLDFRIHF